MLTETDILNALRTCFDSRNPVGLPLNVVDLGLVEHIALAIDHEAPGAGITGVPVRQALCVTLITPSPDEDSNAILTAQMANCLAGLPGLSRTELRLADSPAWSPRRITVDGRKLLRLDPAPFAILNNRAR